MPRPWRQAEILDDVEHCRRGVQDTFAGLTDGRAATPTPSMAWTPYARVLTGLVAHTNEHAAQIPQHLNTRP